MSQSSVEGYQFDPWVPIDPIAPGSTVFVAGPSMGAAIDLALSLTVAGTSQGDGAVLLSTNTGPTRLIDRAERVSPAMDRSRTTVVDGSGREGDNSPTGVRVASLSGPGDLTGMGINLSSAFENFHADGITRVRTGVVSVSTLLMYVDLRTVFRFLHTISGRITAVDGFGVFYIDPDSHDSRSTTMLTQISDGRIDVREAESEDHEWELAVRGLPDRTQGWRPFAPGGEGPNE
jgi:hypothetical protein